MERCRERFISGILRKYSASQRLERSSSNRYDSGQLAIAELFEDYLETWFLTNYYLPLNTSPKGSI
jgi:hypothetical protein